MLRVRTVGGVKMYEAQQWLVAALLQALVLSASCSSNHHRRAAPTQATFQQTKGGWRPVVSSGGVLYGSFGTAPLHAQAYKIPVPVIDYSSSHPLAVRDAAKVTSIAQSYRPTTLRTVPSQSPPPPTNQHQPINSYHNPFALQNNGLTHFKYLQNFNFPADSVIIRNPHNPYAARPVYSKLPTKYKQPLQNSMVQQLTNVQPIQFGQYQTAKPFEAFGKPVESYSRPDKKQYSGTEIFKPQVFEVKDNDPASQSLSQQVKTAQQQSQGGTQKTPVISFPQFSYQDSLLPSNILGSFGSFAVQSIKGRDPVFPTTKTTYFASQPTKQTIFNSFSYSPNYKSTPSFSNIYSTTTPKLQTTPSYATFGSTYSDFKVTPAQQTKPPTVYKIDPNAGKTGFKPSPQDPFVKQYQSDLNKISVTTYSPTTQSTTLASNYFNDYSFPSQQNAHIQNYFNQHGVNYNYDKHRHNIQDSVAAGGNQQTQQYANPPKNVENTNGVQNSLYRPTYEVTETTEADDVITHSSPAGWAAVTSQAYDYNQKATEEPKKTTTPQAAFVEEFAIVTEAEKTSYDNSLNYDGQDESQSRRPLGDDFEPIGQHKLKDYYYKVSTPANDDYSTTRRTKKPTESNRFTSQPETTTASIFNDIPIETLPTLPPNRHFKRPSATEPIDKEKIRKRNKIRRRRPAFANLNRGETSPTANMQSSESSATTESDEIYTIRPRLKTTHTNLSSPTTPSVTTDLTTSALPTVTPTAPTVLKKKLGHRRPVTTTSSRIDTTTQVSKDYESNKDSSIMKIATRPLFPKLTAKPFEYKTDFPDYSHKQDEKDTPTSDVSVSLSDSKSTADSAQDFSFHKDVRPIEAKLEPVTNQFRETTTEFVKDNDFSNEVTTSLPTETTTTNGRLQRPRLRNKYNTRPRFSVQDYKSRLSSTTSTTERAVENTPKVRFPQRRGPNVDNETENVNERKKFTPKDPRHKQANNTEGNEQTEKEIHSIRQSVRQRPTVAEASEGLTQKISARIRNGSRKPRPEEATETTPTVIHKRPIRKKIKDADLEESVQDISVAETTANYDRKNDMTSERTRSESAIMKIADKKHQDHSEHIFEHSKRVSDLTLAASKDYNKPGMFKTISTNSRRIPNYFTIATDDPILPIEAFFPQLNQKKEA